MRGSQTFAVTSVFVNQNDLATYLAICWPFVLCAFFFTRRFRLLALAALSAVFIAAAFIRTGSRTSLLAVALETVVALVLFEGLSARLTTRRGKIAIAVLGVVLMAGASYLLFNNSQSPLLRQFRLASLISQAKNNKGSGALRADLTRDGFQIAGGHYSGGRRPRSGRGDPRPGRPDAGHLQPARLVAGDLCGRRPARACCCSSPSSSA